MPSDWAYQETSYRAQTYNDSLISSCTFYKLALEAGLVAGKEHVGSALNHEGVLVAEGVGCEGIWGGGCQVSPLKDMLQHLQTVLIRGISVNILDILPRGAQEGDAVQIKLMRVGHPAKRITQA